MKIHFVYWYNSFMKLIILNGPTGTGKNRISTLIGKKRQHCSGIDFDVLRNMFAQPHKAPWEGEEGRQQQLLGVKQACLLVRSFLENNFDVILLDVLSDETAQIYQENLQQFSPKLVLLLPTFAEIQRRNLTRPPRLTDDELKMVYEQQTQLKIFDQKIDNTYLSAEEVAEMVNEEMA